MDYLVSLGRPVRVLGVDILPADGGVEVSEPIQFEYAQLDLLDQPGVEKLLSAFEPDYVLHLAAYSSVGYSWENPVESFRNNTNIFLNLIDTIRRLGLAPRVLSIGSSEQYGIVEESGQPIEESTPQRPASPYAIARVAQEQIAALYADSFAMDVVMTRSFNHIGPRQPEKFVVSSFAKQLLRIKNGEQSELRVGNLEIERDFVDVRDVVRAYHLLLESGQAGEVYNVCGGTGWQLSELIGKMSEILGVRPVITVDPERLRPSDPSTIVGSNAKIRRDLGWSPTIGIDQTLGDLVSFWRRRPDGVETTNRTGSRAQRR